MKQWERTMGREGTMVGMRIRGRDGDKRRGG